jgi:hypothetical protein
VRWREFKHKGAALAPSVDYLCVACRYFVDRSVQTQIFFLDSENRRTGRKSAIRLARTAGGGQHDLAFAQLFVLASLFDDGFVFHLQNLGAADELLHLRDQGIGRLLEARVYVL